jgi:hypothetical protein
MKVVATEQWILLLAVVSGAATGVFFYIYKWNCNLDFFTIACEVANEIFLFGTEIFSSCKCGCTRDFASCKCSCNWDFFQLQVWLQLRFSLVASVVASETFSSCKIDCYWDFLQLQVLMQLRLFPAAIMVEIEFFSSYKCGYNWDFCNKFFNSKYSCNCVFFSSYK